MLHVYLSYVKILSVVVCSVSPDPFARASPTTVAAGGHSSADAPVTTTDGGEKDGANAVSLSNYVFALTVLGAYFIQL